jgi:hypothetical protein
MNKRVFFFIITLILGVKLAANDVIFTMTGPDIITAGEQFSLTLSLNAEGQDLKLPEMSDFEVLMGPSISQSRSFSSMNGKMTQSVNYSYTFILRAPNEGTFTIPAASIKSNRSIVQSNSLTIKVIKGRQPTATPGTAQQPQPGNTQARTGQATKDELFIQYDTDKRNVYKGEMIYVTLKLYSRVNLSVADQTLPSFEGFWTQDIEIASAEQTRTREAVDGIIYNVYTIQKRVIIPQQTGTLYIEPAEMVFNVQRRAASQNIFDDFFGSVQNVKVPVKSNRIAINVKDLPPAPAGFKGAVGKFSLTSSIDKTNIKSNDAITLKTKISGTGNLKHITPLNFNFPADFEIYDPKTSYDINASAAGISGSTNFEQVVIPRFAGNFTIPAQPFIYFDPASQSYKNLSTNMFEIVVEKGADDQSASVVHSVSKQDVRQLGQDIKYIKTTDGNLKQRGYHFFGSFNFYFLFILSLLLFAALGLLQKKRIRENADIALMKNRRANKMARKHLKQAAVCVKKNDIDNFYDALLRAFWGYLSDKLTLPLSELNRDNVKATLDKYNVENSTIQEFIELIDNCEMARFAPTAIHTSISEMYTKAEKIISDFEKQIRKRGV